jgi:hypothetical protein
MSTINGSSLLFLKNKIENFKDANEAYKKFNLLIALTEEAFTHFLEGKLGSFDALVGENACELRAAYLLDLVDQGKAFNDTLKETLMKVQEIKGKIINFKDPANYIEVGAFYQKNGLEFELTKDQTFLIQSYLLTKTKITEKQADRSNPSLLCSMVDVGKNFSKNLVNETQKTLSKASVAYIQEEAEKISECNHQEMLTTFTADSMIMKDNTGKVALPCYFALKTVLLRMWEKKQLILYKIHTNSSTHPLFLLFEPSECHRRLPEW